MMRNITVFDLEIKKPIGKGISWGDYDKMGISVGVAYNFKRDEYKVYLDDNIQQLSEDLNASEMITGFNIIGFDIPLLEVTTGIKLHQDIIVYDPLKEHRAIIDGTFLKGQRLDDFLLGTFGKEWIKTGNGADVPIWFQEGKLGKVVSYCIDDVKREAKLFKHIWEGNHVKTPNFGPQLLPDPKALLKWENL